MIQRELAALVVVDFSFQAEGPAAFITESHFATLASMASNGSGEVLGKSDEAAFVKFSDPENSVFFGIELFEYLTKSSVSPRIVAHVEEIIVGDGHLEGEGIEFVQRIASAISASGLFISRSIYDDVQKKMPQSFLRMGEFRFRNFEPIEVFRHKPEVLTKRDIKESQVSHWLLNTILLTFLGLLLSALYFGVFGVETKNQLGDLQKFRERVRKAIHRDGDGK